jgi:hypothetical protein
VPDYRKEARRAARRYGLDPNIFERQIGAESNFDPKAGSSAGAQGIAQIMPDTAKGWGVDPWDAIAALDAAAKNMAQYVKKYGGYENALRAYNAGPGAIERSRGYSETNNYVAKILNGRDPGKLGNPTRSGSDRVSRPTNSLRSQEPNPYQPVNLFQQIADMNPVNVGNTNPMMIQLQETTKKNWEMMGQLQQLLDAPRQELRQNVQPTRSSPQYKSTGGKGKLKGVPHEFFFDPLGGWDEGKSTGAIGGHGTHLHFAANIDLLKQVAKMAEQAGLSVREFEPYDKVDPVHTEGSWHYKGLAADISGSGLMEFAKMLKKRFGLK